MAFDAVEYIEQKLRAYDSTIDISEGSAVRDLLVNPLSSLLQAFNETHQIFENRLSVTDLNALSETALDDIASNMGITRAAGSKATGYVRIYFKTPQSITIRRNTELRTSDGRKYYSVNEHQVTRSQMLANSERYPLYHTGNILVKALNEGISYELGPQEITTAVNLDFSYELVTNPNAFTGASNKDTNAELYEKLVNAVHAGGLINSKAIKNTLTTNFASLKDVYVVGAGHNLMLRDVAQDTTRPDVTIYTEVDYNGKILNQNSAPYKISQAYYGLFTDENLSNSSYLPSEFPIPDQFSREYSQEQYSQIFAEDAFVTTLTPSQVLVYETFGASGYDSSWTTSDENMGLGVLTYSGEIAIVNNAIYLGNNPSRPGAFISYNLLTKVSGLLDQIQNLA